MQVKTKWAYSFEKKGYVKFFRFMKLTIFFLLVSTLYAGANVNSQSITYKGKDVPLVDVIKVIEKQSGYTFFYPYSSLNAANAININVKDAPLEEALSACFKGQPFTYLIKGKTIVISATSGKVHTAAPATVNMRKGRIIVEGGQLLIGAKVFIKGTQQSVSIDPSGYFELPEMDGKATLVITGANAQTTELVIDNNKDLGTIKVKRKITGTITDARGFIIKGATITIKGTRISAVSKSDGTFTLDVPDGSDSLVVTHVAYQTKTVAITAERSDYIISLEEAVIVQEAIIVNGLYERKASSNTGSTKTLSQEQLKQVSPTNVFTAVAALDPSFRIIPDNIKGGDINQLPDIQIRGANSLPNLGGTLTAAPNLPLFILDGFEVSLQRVKDLDMNLIKSVTILKDAAATAIYGSRGANGIMVITTAMPAPGRIRVTLANDLTINAPDLSSYKLLNAPEKLDFEKRAGLYNTGNPITDFNYEAVYNSRLAAVKKGVNTDWLSYPTRVGVSNRTTVDLQGGDSYIRYGLQLSADLQSGVMKGQNRQNYSGVFNLSYVVKKLRFQNSLSVFQNVANASPYGSFSNYVKLNPYWNPYNEVGNLVQRFESTASPFGAFANPLYDAHLHTINKKQYFGARNNFSVRYNFLERTYFESRFSIEKQIGSGDIFYSAQHSNFANESDTRLKGSYTASNNNLLQLQGFATLNHSFNIKKHFVAASLGTEVASSKSLNYTIITQGFPFDRLDNLLYATQYKENSRPTGGESTIRRVGFFGNANYSYDNRYLFDGSYRKDGSSQFGDENNFNDFWSTGLGWNIHNEKFFRNKWWLNRLKLRASYGLTASVGTSAYNAQTRYDFNDNYFYNGIVGVSIINLGNKDLGWQKVWKRNIGMDAALFKERLDMTVDLYSDLTENAISAIPIAPSTGFLVYNGNLGKLQNTGFEVSARYKVIDDNAHAILWYLFASGSSNKNVLKELSPNIKSVNDQIEKDNTTQVVPNIQLQEGQSMNTLFVVHSLGVDPITGQEVFLKKDGTTTFIWNAADKVAWGNTDPKLNGSFGTNLVFKGFQMNLLFQYSFGSKLYNQTLIDRVESVDVRYNVDRRAYDLGWTKPGDNSLYTVITPGKEPTQLTSRFVQNNNYINMTSASIGYNFYKHALLKKLGLTGLQISAVTNDIFRATSIRYERGTDNPYARAYSISVRAAF